MPQTYSLGGSLNKSRNIRYYKPFGIFQIHHAQVRIQRGKMVVGNFRPGIGHFCQQCGFSHIRETDQSHIRYHLQFQQKIQFFCILPRLGIFRHLHSTGGIVLVPAASPASFQQHITAILPRHIGNYFTAFRFLDHRPVGHLNNQVFPVFSFAVLFSAFFPVSGTISADMPEVRKGVQALIHLKYDIAPLAAVTAVRPAVRHIFLLAE